MTFRSFQTFSGGNPTAGVRISGSSSMGSNSVEWRSANHSVVGKFSTRVLRFTSLLNSSIVLGLRVAISRSISSLKIRPGDISTCLANSSRACQSALIIPRVIRSRTLCIPDVRRQGSLRAAAGGLRRIAAKSSLAQSSFPSLVRSFSTSSRRSTNTSTSRAA